MNADESLVTKGCFQDGLMQKTNRKLKHLDSGYAIIAKAQHS
jgi:hypothetical protein